MFNPHFGGNLPVDDPFAFASEFPPGYTGPIGLLEGRPPTFGERFQVQGIGGSQPAPPLQGSLPSRAAQVGPQSAPGLGGGQPAGAPRAGFNVGGAGGLSSQVVNDPSLQRFGDDPLTQEQAAIQAIIQQMILDQQQPQLGPRRFAR